MCTYGLAVICLVLSIYTHILPPLDDQYVSNVFLGLFTAFVIAGILQPVMGATLDKNFTDSIINRVKEYLKRRDAFTPREIYENNVDYYINKLLIGKDHIMFFGTSANYFLKRLMQYKQLIKEHITIEILLSNPSVEKNFGIRLKQMEKEQGGIVDTISIKKEVIRAIIVAHYLNHSIPKLNFELRLHSETPMMRMEFYGQDDLFLEFYNIGGDGKTPERKGTGPVAYYHQNENSYMFKIFKDYFLKIWDENTTIMISVNKSASISDTLFNKLELADDFVNETINEIANSDKEDINMKEWLAEQIHYKQS
jgi:hypothetical protein